MSKKSVVLDKKCLFPTRFMELCSTEDKPLDSWGYVFDVSRQTVSNWQTGKSVPDIVKLTVIARYFEVSTDYLLGLTDTKKPDVNARAAAAYTGLSEEAVEWLHIGLDDFECGGVGLTESEKARNQRVASAIIGSREFGAMIHRLSCAEENAYDKKMLETLYEDHSKDANEENDYGEFAFANAEDRILTEKVVVHLTKLRRTERDPDSIAKELHEMSDDELINTAFSGMLIKEDDCELQQFYAAKEFNRFIDRFIGETKRNAAQAFRNIVLKD